MNDNDIQLFKQKLGEVNWSSVCSSADALCRTLSLWKSFKNYMMNVSTQSVLRNVKVETTQGRLGYLIPY